MRQTPLWRTYQGVETLYLVFVAIFLATTLKVSATGINLTSWGNNAPSDKIVSPGFGEPGNRNWDLLIARRVAHQGSVKDFSNIELTVEWIGDCGSCDINSAVWTIDSEPADPTAATSMFVGGTKTKTGQMVSYTNPSGLPPGCYVFKCVCCDSEQKIEVFVIQGNVTHRADFLICRSRGDFPITIEYLGLPPTRNIRVEPEPMYPNDTGSIRVGEKAGGCISGLMLLPATIDHFVPDRNFGVSALQNGVSRTYTYLIEQGKFAYTPLNPGTDPDATLRAFLYGDLRVSAGTPIDRTSNECFLSTEESREFKFFDTNYRCLEIDQQQTWTFPPTFGPSTGPYYNHSGIGPFEQSSPSPGFTGPGNSSMASCNVLLDPAPLRCELSNNNPAISLPGYRWEAVVCPQEWGTWGLVSYPLITCPLANVGMVVDIDTSSVINRHLEMQSGKIFNKYNFAVHNTTGAGGNTIAWSVSSFVLGSALSFVGGPVLGSVSLIGGCALRSVSLAIALLGGDPVTTGGSEMSLYVVYNLDRFTASSSTPREELNDFRLIATGTSTGGDFVHYDWTETRWDIFEVGDKVAWGIASYATLENTSSSGVNIRWNELEVPQPHTMAFTWTVVMPPTP